MEAPAQAARADPVSEADSADAGQFCSNNDDAADAINAAWPGDEAVPQFRREVAGLLLRSQRTFPRPHTMTNTDLGKAVRKRNQQLVTQLLPGGGKLKFSKLLLRQPDEPGAGTAPEFFVVEPVGGAPGVRLELKQLRKWWVGAKERGHVEDVANSAAGGDQDAPGTSIPAAGAQQEAIDVKPTAAYATADSTRGAISLGFTGVGTEPSASAPTLVTSSKDTYVAGVQQKERGSKRAGGTGTASPVHGALDNSSQVGQLAATAWPGEGPQAQLLSVETAPCAAGGCSQPGGAALNQSEGRFADEDYAVISANQERDDARAGGGAAVVLGDAAGGSVTRPEADGVPVGQLSTATAAPEVGVVMQADAPPDGDAPGPSLCTPVVPSVGTGYAVVAPGAAQGPGPGLNQARGDADFGLLSGGPSSPLQDLMSAIAFAATQRADTTAAVAAEALRWDRNAPELQALAAALPGDGPRDRLQRRAAALLLQPPPPKTESAYLVQTPLGPHTLTSTELGAQLRQLYPSLVAEVVGTKGKLSFAATLRRRTAAPADIRPSWRAEPHPGPRAPRASAPAPVPKPPEVFTVDNSDPKAPTVRLELRELVDWWQGSSGGGTATGGVVSGSKSASGPVQLRGGNDGAGAAAAGTSLGLPFPGVGAAGPASPVAPSPASSSTGPQEVHGQPPDSIPALDSRPSPTPAGTSARNALPTTPTETVAQLRGVALKIGAHAPDDAFLGAVAAALPGKDPATMLRRRCALLLLARGSGGSQGPLGSHSLTAAALASALVSTFPDVCHNKQYVSGTDDNGMWLAKLLRDTNRTGAGQRPGGADTADTWRRHEAAPGEGPRAHPPVPQVFAVRLEPPEQAAVRLNVDSLVKWWFKVRPVLTTAGACAAGPGASAASPAVLHHGSDASSAAPGQGAVGGAQVGLTLQAAGPSGNGSAAASASPSVSPAPPESSPATADVQSSHMAAAVGSRLPSAVERLGAFTAFALEEETLYLGPQRPGHAQASLTAIPGGEGARGGGGSGGGAFGAGGGGAVRGGGGKSGMAPSRSGDQWAGEDPWQLERRRREVEAAWQKVCRARGHEALRMPPGLAAACVAAWSDDNYVSALRRTAAVLLLVPPPRVEGGAADHTEEELGLFTLYEDAVECDLAEHFPKLASPFEGNGRKRWLRRFLNNTGSTAANGKQGQPEQQTQPSAEEEGGADGAAAEQDPARPPRLFTALETPTGSLALRLNLLALQQWWAGRSSTHTADLGHGTGLPLAPTGRNTSPLPPPNPAASGLWVEALRGRRGHLAPLPSADLPCADSTANGEAVAGVAGGRHVAVRWHRSATRFARGIVGRGLDFWRAEGGGGDAEQVDARLCVREVQLHRRLERCGVDVVQAAAIAAAWRGGGAAAQLGRRLAAMLLQPPAAAQGPAGPCSASKAALCSELRAMYPELVAELLLALPQSPTPSEQSPTADRAGGWGSTGDLPLEQLLLPASPASSGNGRAVPGGAARPPFFSFEDCSTGQVAVRLHVEALGLRCDGEAPALREHERHRQHQNLAHEGGSGRNRSTAVLAAGSADAYLGSGACDGAVPLGSGGAVLQSACPSPPAPRPRSALLLEPVDVRAPPWWAGAAASDLGAPQARPSQLLLGSPSTASRAQLMRQEREQCDTAAGAPPSPSAPTATADAGAATSTSKAATAASDVPTAATFAPATDADRAVAQRTLLYDWPGVSPLEQLWREVAAVLLRQTEGQGGPLGRHSQLSARLSSGLRSSHPALVAQVLPLAGGTLRWATLLEHLQLQQHVEGGVAVQMQQQQPGSQTTTPTDVQGAAGGSAAAGGAGAGAPGRLPASVPGRFLRVVKHPQGGVVQLDVYGLARWWEGVEVQLQGQRAAAAGGSVQQDGGPMGPAAAVLPPPPPPQQQHQRGMPEGPARALGNGVAPVQGVLLRLLPLWAFPGTATERALRRDLAGRLAPSAEDDAAVKPPPGKPLSQLLTMHVSVAANDHPARSSPAALVAFLMHPDSRGVFRLAQDDSSHSSISGGGSNGVKVALNPDALRLAAARGLAEAVAAAWPGEGPLPRLRRAAAEVLARVAAPATGPTGEHSMAAGNLGHVLSRQLGEGYRAAVDSVAGKKLLAALADQLDGPGLIQCDMQAAQQGAAKLCLGALLRNWPRAAAAAGCAPGAAGGRASPGPATADGSTAAGTRSAAGERQPQPPQAQQGQAASAAALRPSANPMSRFADAAGPSSSTNVVPGPAAATATADGAGAPTATGLDDCVQAMPLRLLPLWAFPGTAPGQVLRRGCADKLVVAQGGQPGPLSLAVLLELFGSNPEALAPLRPQPSPTSLAVLLNHPDSGGVFQLYQDRAHGTSNSFSVDLVAQTLRRKAARGLAEAVAAAWPGDAPLPRLRRAAAMAMACEDGGPGSPTGSRHVSGEVLAGRLRKQLGGQAVPHSAELPGKLVEGDATELFAVEVRKKEPWARLRLSKMLRNWPSAPVAVAAAAAADTAARVAGPLLAAHAPHPGTMLVHAPLTAAAADPGLLASTGVRPPSSTSPPQEHQRLHPSAVPPTNLNTGGGSDGNGLQGVPLKLLPLWAFPGTAPDRCLRRCVAYQAVLGNGAKGQGQGQDEGQVSLRLLLEQRPRDSAAAAALSSHRSVASLAAFLTHPDSRGVFRCDLGAGTVTVDPHTLRLAAARGLAESVAAAWPGEGPLPRLRRAAAELLARAATGPAQRHHRVKGSDLGHALNRQLGDHYKAAVGSVPGKKLFTALADGGDGQGLIMFDTKANYARLDVGMLLHRFPRTAAPTAAAPTAASAASTGAANTAPAPTPAAAHAPPTADPDAHHLPNPLMHESNQSITPLARSRETALVALQLALLDLFPDPPRPTGCRDPTAASSSTAPAPPASPSPAVLAEWEERRLEARVKRAAAEALALRGSQQRKGPEPARVRMPCDQLWTSLCRAVPELLGGQWRRSGWCRGLKDLLSEEPHVFSIAESVRWSVLLVHPELIEHGDEAQRTMSASYAGSAAAAVPAEASTSANLAAAGGAGAVAGASSTPAGVAAAQPHPQQQQQQQQQQPAPQPLPVDPATALREAVQRRFPYPPHNTARGAGQQQQQAQQLEAEAKRAAALVLAMTGAGALPPAPGAAPPSRPFELPLTNLCVATYAALGGARPARKLRVLLEEEPGAFTVRTLSHGFLAVRLVEGGLIRLGRQAQRQGTSTGAAEPALEGAQAAGEPAQAPPLPPPPPPQQQQQLRDNVQAQGPDKGRAAAAAGNAAAAVAQEPQPAQGQPQEHPLRRHLEKLFPYPQGPSTPAPARLQVEAKRALAQLLADAPPPHQVHASALGAPLLQLLGGRRCPDGMRRLCATSPRVFEVVPQATNAAQYSVRLKHSKLLDQAAKLHRRRQLQQQQEEQEQLRRRQQEEQAQQEQGQGGNGGWPAAEAAAPEESPDELDTAAGSVGLTPVPQASTSNVRWPAVGGDDWAQLGSDGASDAGSGADACGNGESDAVAIGTVPGQEPQGHRHQGAASNPMVVPVSVPVPSAVVPEHAPHHVSSSPPQAMRPVYAPLQQQPRVHTLDEGRGAVAAGSVQGAVQLHHRGQEQQGLEPEQGQEREDQDAAVHSFHRYLEQLFPFPPDATTLPPDPLMLSLPDELSQPEPQPDSDAHLEVEAKRAVAQLLAEAPPPHHQLLSNFLGAQLRKLLGGRKCPGGGLRRLCMSASHVFEVLPQDGTNNCSVNFIVRLTHPELLARAVEVQGVRDSEQQQEQQQQQEQGGSAAAAGYVEQRLAAQPMVIPIPIPVPSADATHLASTTTSSPPPAAPAPLQQQPQQLSPRYDPLRQHPTHHPYHPYLHQLLLPPHLVQSLPQPATLFVHWTGARHVTGPPPEPSPSSASSHDPAPAPELGPAHSSWRDALSQLLTHSRAARQVGMAVLRVCGAASLVALYVPPTAAPAASAPVAGVLETGQAAEAGAGAAAAEVSGVSRALGATVYVVDLAVPHPDSEEAAAAEAEAAAKVGAGQGQVDGRAGGGPAAYTYAVVEALRAVLEDGRVAKVVHGAQQIDALEVTCGQQLRSKPILDTRQVLEAMLLGPFFPDLPPPPPPPTPSAPHAHPLLPTARMAEALRAARLRAHVEGVRRALGGTGLWDDRPQLLELLSARQLAALGDEHDAAAGRDRVWAERPLSPDRVLSAAQRAAHLPELWTALAHEALPWASMHAAAQAAERRRMEREVAAAAAAEPVAAGDASGTGL